MEEDLVPGRVRVLIASEPDEASRNQRAALLELASWSEDEAFEGSPAWSLRDTLLVTTREAHLYRDHLDRDLSIAFGETLEFVVYLSKHRSESETRSLTVHPIGNPVDAAFGGQPGVLVPAAARWMTAALRALRREARSLPYEVTFEATHHGPYLESPTFFIEQGSTEPEWEDREASAAIARALLDLAPLDAPVAVGMGGGHYVPRHRDLALERKIAFGHLLPAYALEHAPASIVDQAVERTAGARFAYVHRKTLSKPLVRTIEERLASLDVRVVREADIPLEGGAETS
jgi:D-aminoacyl-tRNA deacylase